MKRDCARRFDFNGNALKPAHFSLSQIKRKGAERRWMRANGWWVMVERPNIRVANNLHNHIKAARGCWRREEKKSLDWAKGALTAEERARNGERKWRNAVAKRAETLGGAGWDWIARDYDTVTHIPSCLVARRTVVAPGRVDSQLPRAYTPIACTHTHMWWCARDNTTRDTRPRWNISKKMRSRARSFA